VDAPTVIAASSGSGFVFIIIIAFLLLYLIVVRPQRKRQNQQQNMASPRTQRHAQTKLRRPLAHRVGDHSVGADRREHDSQSTE